MLGGLDYLRELNILSVTLRLLLAMLLGGLIGMERGRKRRPAGFRTYMLVCLGATLTGILSQYLTVMLATDWAAAAAAVGRRVDVSRIGSKAIGGVGFLGAGTILITGRQEVKGLTTAAGLWASACMGIAIGAGFYECVMVAFALIVLCIRFLPVLEGFIIENARNMNLYVEFLSLDNLGEIIGRVKEVDAHIYDVDIDHGAADGSRHPSAVFSIRLNHKTHHEKVIAAISEVESVTMLDEI